MIRSIGKIFPRIFSHRITIGISRTSRVPNPFKNNGQSTTNVLSKNNFPRSFNHFSTTTEQKKIELRYEKTLHLLEDYMKETKNNEKKLLMKEIVEGLQFCAEKGHADSQYRLATCLLDGLGVKKNPEKGVELLVQAAQTGHLK
jgi:TPR repeat protein